MEKPHNPERISPELEVTLGDLAITLTYYNANIFTYDEPFDHLNHVYIRDEVLPTGAFIFSNRLVEELAKHRFPSHRQPWPEAGDEEAYVMNQLQTLENEL